jgi:hypothetical protein
MASFDDSAHHGLAQSIRSVTTSEQFDLGGFTGPSAEALIANAFGGAPFSLAEMVKVSLVVGAGKGGRAKYDAALPRAVSKVPDRSSHRASQEERRHIDAYIN